MRSLEGRSPMVWELTGRRAAAAMGSLGLRGQRLWLCEYVVGVEQGMMWLLTL